MLCEVAHAIAHSRDNYLSAQFQRIARRRGKPKAILAVAHSVLIRIYYVLRDKKPYNDLGATLWKLDAARIERHHVRRLEQMGFSVSLSPKDAT